MEPLLELNPDHDLQSLIYKHLFKVYCVLCVASIVLFCSALVTLLWNPGVLFTTIGAVATLMGLLKLPIPNQKIKIFILMLDAMLFGASICSLLLMFPGQVAVSDTESGIFASLISVGCFLASVLHALASQRMVMLERLFYMGGLTVSGIMTLCWLTLAAAHFGNLARFTQLLAGFWTIFVFLLIVYDFCVSCQRDHQARQIDEAAH